MGHKVTEIIWISNLIKELGIECKGPAELFCDNKAVMKIAANPIYHERTEHIDIKCHTVRERINDGIINTCYIQTSEQLVDLFKSLLVVNNTSI